jgi:3-oxoacyl-[acyl-carrier protein] reductase
MGNATYDFRGRRVLVTGGTRGLGLTIATAFLRSGASVSVTGTSYTTSSYDADLTGIRYHQLELTDHDSIARVADEAGRIDVLVNAAGLHLPHPHDPTEREFAKQATRIGLVGPMQLTSRLRYRLAESTMRGGGAVVNTQSVCRWFELAHGAPAAHTQMLETTARLAGEWARSGIRVNTVAATVTVPRQSQLSVQIERNSGPLLTRRRPVRSGTFQDVASVALFLASSGAAYVTGQTLTVNGGHGGARLGGS